jgi:hypothetical protein
MRIERFSKTVAIALLGLMGCVSALQPARADVALEGGALVTNGGTSGAGAVSLGLFGTPVVPLSGDITFADAGGGYAATFDARLALGPTAVGAGIGFGSVGDTHTTSGVYDALIAQRILPHTSIEARMYFGPNSPSSLLAGLRFSL